MTVAPFSAINSAVARPTPRPPPQTILTLSSSMDVFEFFRTLFIGFCQHINDTREVQDATVGRSIVRVSRGPATCRRADVVRTDVFDGLQDVFADYDLLVSAAPATTAFPFDAPPETIADVEIEPLRV